MHNLRSCKIDRISLIEFGSLFEISERSSRRVVLLIARAQLQSLINYTCVKPRMVCGSICVKLSPRGVLIKESQLS